MQRIGVNVVTASPLPLCYGYIEKVIFIIFNYEQKEIL